MVEQDQQQVAGMPPMEKAGTAAQNNPEKEAPSNGPHPVEGVTGQVSVPRAVGPTSQNIFSNLQGLLAAIKELRVSSGCGAGRDLPITHTLRLAGSSSAHSSIHGFFTFGSHMMYVFLTVRYSVPSVCPSQCCSTIGILGVSRCSHRPTWCPSLSGGCPLLLPTRSVTAFQGRENAGGRIHAE